MDARADGMSAEPRKSTVRMGPSEEAAINSLANHWQGDVAPQVSSIKETNKWLCQDKSLQTCYIAWT